MSYRVVCSEGENLKDALKKALEKADKEMDETDIIISTTSSRKDNKKFEVCIVIEKT